MYKYLTVFQPLRKSPSFRSAKVCDILPMTVLEPTGQYETEVIGREGVIFEQVIYQTNSQELLGFIPSRYLEPFEEPFPNVVKAGSRTLNPSDAAQYILYKDQVQFNLCGQFCVCYCAYWEYDIEIWLDEWKVKEPSVWSAIFRDGRSRTTGISDLDNMLSSFDEYDLPSVTIQDALHDQFLKRPLLTPGRLSDVLRKNRVILSCRIETIHGRLQEKGILHWIVVEKVERERYGGMVHVYNPFPDTIEIYPWDLFVKSAGNPYGILVAR